MSKHIENRVVYTHFAKKTKAWRKWAKREGLKVKDIKLAQYEPGDLTGYPIPEPEVLAEVYRVLNGERFIGDHKLKPDARESETVDHAHATPKPMFDMLMDVAASLLDVESGQPNEEYARGICELIGRLRLDIHGIGYGTAENAMEVADMLGVDDIYAKRANFVSSSNKANERTERERVIDFHLDYGILFDKITALEAKVADQTKWASELAQRITELETSAVAHNRLLTMHSTHLMNMGAKL